MLPPPPHHHHHHNHHTTHTPNLYLPNQINMKKKFGPVPIFFFFSMVIPVGGGCARDVHLCLYVTPNNWVEGVGQPQVQQLPFLQSPSVTQRHSSCTFSNRSVFTIASRDKIKNCPTVACAVADLDTYFG
jgi:hypothetical protein